jgi:cobalt-zinc-cadmium resistance protein CzcA
MIGSIVDFSVRRRWLVLLVTLTAAASGFWSFTKLPIDAVPDVTNVQVQVNAVAPALTPDEIEKQVTVALEAALAGIPGMESLRSFSRNGFAQITAVFTDHTNIYFARQLVSERINDAKSNLPPGVDVRMGPVSTGLGEIYWWAVEYEKPGANAPVRDGQPGWQSDGSYLTPEGERLADDFQRTVYLRTVQDWIIRPQLRTVPGVAGADAIGGFVKQFQVQPDPARLIGYGLAFGQVIAAIEANKGSRGAGYIEQNGESLVVRAAGRVENLDDISNIVLATRGGVVVRVSDVAAVAIGRELRTGSASVDGREVVLGTVLMLIGGNSRTVAAAADARITEIRRTFAAGYLRPHSAEPDRFGGRDDPHGREQSGGRRPSRHCGTLPAARKPTRGHHHGLRDSGDYADHRHGNAPGPDQRQPHEPGRAGLRPDRGRRSHHHREQLAPSRRSAA